MNLIFYPMYVFPAGWGREREGERDVYLTLCLIFFACYLFSYRICAIWNDHCKYLSLQNQILIVLTYASWSLYHLDMYFFIYSVWCPNKGAHKLSSMSNFISFMAIRGSIAVLILNIGWRWGRESFHKSAVHLRQEVNIQLVTITNHF